MNFSVMSGRLTKDPEVRYGGSKNIAIAKFSLAVDRRFKHDGQPEADFFNCVAFGKTGEFVEKYLHKGTKIIVQGEFQNNHYKDKKGNMQYAEQLLVNQIEFAESKKAAQQNQQPPVSDNDDFMNIPDDSDLDDLPFV